MKLGNVPKIYASWWSSPKGHKMTFSSIAVLSLSQVWARPENRTLSNLSQPLSYHSRGNSTSNVFQEFQITSVLHPHHTFLTNSNNGFYHSLGHNLHVYVKCAVDLSILGEWSELYLWSSGQISDVWWNEWQHSQGLNLKSFIGNQFLINLFTKIAYLHLAHVLLT